MIPRCPTCGHRLNQGGRLTPRELDVLTAWWMVGTVKGAADQEGIGEQRAKNLLRAARTRNEPTPCYRWEPLGGDCTRHHGPHKGFHCNGAVGRLIEVYHDDDAALREQACITVERIAQKIEDQINDPVTREHYPEAVSVYQNALGIVLEESRAAALEPVE